MNLNCLDWFIKRHKSSVTCSIVLFMFMTTCLFLDTKVVFANTSTVLVSSPLPETGDVVALFAIAILFIGFALFICSVLIKRYSGKKKNEWKYPR